MNTKEAKIVGATLTQPTKQITGLVKIELRLDSVYYTWSVLDEEAKVLATGDRLLARESISRHKNPFEFTLDHAVQAIRTYRVGNIKQFAIKDVVWG
jgi:hypothetical protein